ncbi:hypothetical protein [Haloarchaeobius sp. FL176]|nr:hypothetical protein [Haloarchaeobius sp. FL176]
MTGRSVETDDDDADDEADEGRPDAHLRDLDPGAGCTEIWEHLSEERDEE